MDTGEKILLLEDLSDGVQSGYFFGPHSPHNWGKDLDALTRVAPGVTTERIASIAFEEAAKMHAKHWWCNSELKSISWLRSTDWLQGHGEQSWTAAQTMGKDAWTLICSLHVIPGRGLS